MSSSRSTINVVIKALDQFSSPLRKMHRQLSQLRKQVMWGDVNASWRNFGRSIRNVGNETQLLVQRMGGLSLATAGLFGAFIKPASDMEQLRFRLQNLYGDDQGLEMMGKLQKYALKSSYGLQTITQSLLTLKNFGYTDFEGFQGIMDFMATRVPDQTSASRAIMQIGQAWGKGKLQMQDIKPMIENGINVWELLAEATGKPIAKLQDMSSKGELTRSVMLQLFNLMREKSLKDSGKIFELWATKVSNLEDVWDVFTDKVMNTKLGELSLFGEMKNDLQALADLMINGLSDEQARKVARTLSDIYTVVKDLVMVAFDIGKALTPLVKQLSDLVGGNQNLIKWLLVLMAIPLALSLANTVMTFGVLLFTISRALVLLPIMQTAIYEIYVAFLIGAEGITVFWTAFLAPFLEVVAVVGVITALIMIIAGIPEYWDDTKNIMDNLWNGFIKGARDAYILLDKVLAKIPGLERGSWAVKLERDQKLDQQYKQLTPAEKQRYNTLMQGEKISSTAGLPTAQAKKDKLDIAMKVDVEKGTAQVKHVDYSGNSLFNFVNMGGMTGVTT